MPASGRVDGRKYVLKTKGLGFKAILLVFPLFYRLSPPLIFLYLYCLK